MTSDIASILLSVKCQIAFEEKAAMKHVTWKKGD